MDGSCRTGALGITGYCNTEENTYLSSDEVFFRLLSNYSILYVPPARPSVLVSDARHYTEAVSGSELPAELGGLAHCGGGGVRWLSPI